MNNHQNYGQAPQYGPADFRPPKRRHSTLRGIVIGTIVICGIALVAGMFAAVEQTPATDATTGQPAARPGKPAATPTGKPTGQTGTKRDTRLDRNKPSAVKVGAAIVKGKHRLEAGWSVGSSDYLESFEMVGAEVTNVSDKPSAAFFDVKLYKGPKLLGEISCHSPSIEPGETAEADCYSGDDYTKGWDRVTVGATF